MLTINKAKEVEVRMTMRKHRKWQLFLNFGEFDYYKACLNIMQN